MDQDDKGDMDDKAIQFLIKLANTQGAACANVKDGHVILMQRSYLQSILDKTANKEHVLLFIQRREFKN